MRICDGWADQLRNPHGWFAPVTATLLNRGNATLIGQAIDAAGVTAGERVLDIGFGGGVSLQLLLDRVGHGEVAGVDISAEMVERARRRHRDAVRSGRLALEVAPAAALPFPAGHFHAVLAVHTVYFWPDPEEGLREVRRVLVPGGRVVLGLFPGAVQEVAASRIHALPLFSEEQAADALRETGFEHVAITAHSTSRRRPGGVVLVGVSPDHP